MIYPTATDLLRTIDHAIEEKIEPSLKDLTGRSAMATVRHLLRYVMIRLEKEGQTLTDDIAALRKLLPEVRTYFLSLGDKDGSKAQAKMIEDALVPRFDPTKYRTLDSLAEEGAVLREALYKSLERLQALRGTYGKDASYHAVRAAIRSYIVKEIEQEGEIIAPSFFGRGPRR